VRRGFYGASGSVANRRDGEGGARTLQTLALPTLAGTEATTPIIPRPPGPRSRP
jgi:hypothetical protein